MTDIIDLFLNPENVELMNRLFSGSSHACGMHALMSEFIHEPYFEGAYAIWTGTDADLYLNQMNDEFIKYMGIRYQRQIQKPIDPLLAETSSARVEMAAYADPFMLDKARRDREEMQRPRRPITRGTGASCGGAAGFDHGRARPVAYDNGSLQWYADRAAAGTFIHERTPCPRTSCSLPPQSALACACTPQGRFREGLTQQPQQRRAVPRSSPFIDQRVPALGFRPTSITDEHYARWNRDQSSAMHLATRDDEGSDVGHFPLSQRFAASAQRAALPYDIRESNPWLSDPCAGSGEAQYHLIELDAQMAVLNQERTIPLGYGNAEEQLADDARIAARYVDRVPEVGVIPKTSYKKLTRVQAADGRVTLADDYKLARDIFSRDSKGFILSGRR